jgi:hypothetical protein
VSCGLENPIHEGISTEKSLQDDFERLNAQEVASRFFFTVNCRKVFCNIVVRKGQGARAKNRRQSRLKQLRVAVSTGASLPIGSSPQNSKTNFVDLRDDGSNFQKLTNISPKSVLDRNTRTASFFNMPSSFQKLTKISAKNMLEIRE